MLNIQIKTIPHHFQEYDTVGNYWRDVNNCGAEALEIRVSRMSDRRHEFLVALHEMIEAFLCDWRRIPFAEITRFDIEFEGRAGAGRIRRARRRRCARPIAASISSPSSIERIVAQELEVDWPQYNRAVERL